MNFLRINGNSFAAAIHQRAISGETVNVSEVARIMEEFDFPLKKIRLLPTRILSFVNKSLLGFFHVYLLFLLISIILLIITACLQFNSSTWADVFVPIGAIVLVGGILCQSFNLLYHQYVLGDVDSIQKSVGLRLPYWERKAFEVSPYTNQAYQDFLWLLVKTLSTAVLGFAAIYSALAWVNAEAFNDLTNEFLLQQMELIYYSLATITTIGAGPIQPNWIWAKLAAGLEIIVGISLLVVFVSGFTSQRIYKVVHPEKQEDVSGGA